LGLWKYLFGNVYEISVIIDRARINEAREIFSKHNAHEQPITGRLRLEFPDREGQPEEKVNLCYLVDSVEIDNLSHDLSEQVIEGTTRLNAIISEPYSLRARIAHMLYR